MRGYVGALVGGPADALICRVFALFCVGSVWEREPAPWGRGRELGVRRVLGVSARSIAVLLTGEFTGLVLTASVVCPLICLAMNHWLDQFAYRQDSGLFVFFGGIAVLLVTWLTGGRSGAANRVA